MNDQATLSIEKPVHHSKGSVFVAASGFLPKDHWIYAPWEFVDGAYIPKELPTPVLKDEHRYIVCAAIRYSIRCATNRGIHNDIDPDAVVQNAVDALCGPFQSADYEATGGASSIQADGKTITAPDFLRRAADIMLDRGKQYDKPEGERSMGKCVSAFNIVTGRDLTEAEGWLLMQLLKDVRQWQKPGFHQDSADDCIAYAALKAEAKMKEARHG